ncbi:uncharacterized protein LOC125944425 [Dermacentor silvarum]|uniref:uncharacterized protein LOC125944425 n=1 Tax=Dermacentor silvarum TaxID=543639 RepID=UPI0021013A57|nr:uncharacterized protein LOC125944425 [Dermacentor silvarum]
MESPKDVMLTATPTAASSYGEPPAPRTRLIGAGNVHRGSRSYSIQSFGRRSSRDATPLEKQPTIRRFQIDEQQIFGSTGLLMPLYLSPLIYQGTPESLCLYSVLLPLCWWATGSIPRCVAALAPMVTLPVLQTMSADDAAAAFLTPASLGLFIVLAITTAGYSSGNMIPRLSFTVCSKYGLQVVPLFLWLAAVTYVTSLFVPKAVVAVLLNLVVDKILSCIHHCELDKTLIEQQDQREEPEKPSPQPVQTRQASVTSIETERLLAELAEVVVQLDHECADCKKIHKGSCRPPEPQREKWEIEEPPLPAPPTRRQPSLVSGNASRRRRSYGNSSTGSPGAFSPTSTTEQRYSSLNLRLYQIKKEGKSALDSCAEHLTAQQQSASPAPRSGVPGCSTQSTPCAEVISNRSVSASPSPCKAGTDQKGAAACQKQASASCLSSGATSTFEQSVVKKTVASQGTKEQGTKNKEEAVERTAADGGADKGKHERDKGGAVSSTSKKKKKRSRHTKVPPNPNEPATVASPKRQRKRAHIGDKENVIEISRDNLDSKADPVSVTPTSPLVSAVASIASSVTPAFETTQSATPVPVGGEAAAVDMRRPSILKLPLRPKGWVPGLRYGAQSGTTGLRKFSTVEFGLAHQVDIVDDEHEQDREEEDRERPENLLRTRFSADVPVKRPDAAAAAGPRDSGGLTDKAAGTSPATSPSSPITSESRTASRCKARRYSVAVCVASPSGVAMTEAELAQRRALVSARRQFSSSASSLASVASTKEDKLATRLRLQMSQRTAFMLCCSLVTMTASLSSSLTMAAMDALTQHAVVKRGATGLLTWLLLTTPASLVATAFCCASLYVLHLRNRYAVKHTTRVVVSFRGGAAL